MRYVDRNTAKIFNGHPLANGLRFASLGVNGGFPRVEDSSRFRRTSTLTGLSGAQWCRDGQLQRMATVHNGATYYLPGFSMNAGPWSISLWVKIASGRTGTYQHFAGDYNNAGNSNSLSIVVHSGSIKLIVTNGFAVTGPSATEAWIHVVGQRLTGLAYADSRLVVNGVPYTGYGASGPGFFPVTIGAGTAAGGSPAYAQIADVMIWNRYLTPADANMIYRGGPSISGLLESKRFFSVGAAKRSNRRRRVLAGAAA